MVRESRSGGSAHQELGSEQSAAVRHGSSIGYPWQPYSMFVINMQRHFLRIFHDWVSLANWNFVCHCSLVWRFDLWRIFQWKWPQYTVLAISNCVRLDGTSYAVLKHVEVEFQCGPCSCDTGTQSSAHRSMWRLPILVLGCSKEGHLEGGPCHTEEKFDFLRG